ncbi:MAG: hypothetical protein AAF270_01380 [Pseudomonadota bacterium]
MASSAIADRSSSDVSVAIWGKLISRVSGVLLLFCVLATSGYALSTLPGFQSHFALIVPLVTMLLLAAHLRTLDRLVAYPLVASLVAVLTVASALSIVANPTIPNVMTTGKFLLIIMFAYVFTCFVSYRAFSVWLVRGMIVVGLLSLVVYALTNFAGLDLQLPVFVNVNGMPYKIGLVFFVFDNHLFFRNTGPFWEPGIFGTYLSLTMVLLIINRSTDSKKHFLVLGLCLISTVSTASIIFFILVACLYVFNLAQTIFQRLLLSTFAVMCLIFAVLLKDPILATLVELSPRIFSKFAVAESLSVIERVNSPAVNWALFLEKPLFGWGLSGALSAYEVRTSVSQTSTSTYMLASLGVPGIIYTVAWIFAALRQRQLSLFARALLVVIFIGFLNKEPHYFFPLTFIFLFYWLRSANTQRDEVNRTDRQIKMQAHPIRHQAFSSP